MKGWDFQYIQQTSETTFTAVFFFYSNKKMNMLGIINYVNTNDGLLGNHKILLKKVKILMIQKFKRMRSKYDIQHNPNLFFKWVGWKNEGNMSKY